MRRFEFVGGASAKFWEISQRGPKVTVRFGRLGTRGQTQTKDLGSESAAAAQAAKLIDESFDALTLTVGISPRDRQTALALAAEHFAFCPDNVWQGAGTLAAYAESLRQSATWTFWWD